MDVPWVVAATLVLGQQGWRNAFTLLGGCSNILLHNETASSKCQLSGSHCEVTKKQTTTSFTRQVDEQRAASRCEGQAGSRS